MFHGTIMEEVAAGQRSDRLKKAEMARLLQATRLGNTKREPHYLQDTRDFVNRLKLNGMRQITAVFASLS